MFYNKVLGEFTMTELPSKNPNLTVDISTIKSKNSTKDLYQNLTSLVIATGTSINPNCKSAIYIIDPIKQVFTLQEGKAGEFADVISAGNIQIKKYI